MVLVPDMTKLSLRVKRLASSPYFQVSETQGITSFNGFGASIGQFGLLNQHLSLPMLKCREPIKNSVDLCSNSSAITDIKHGPFYREHPSFPASQAAWCQKNENKKERKAKEFMNGIQKVATWVKRLVFEVRCARNAKIYVLLNVSKIFVFVL